MQSSNPIIRWRSFLLLALAVVCWETCLGQAFAVPQITNLSLRGLQTGATTTLIVNGADLIPEPRIILSVPIANQVVKPGATASRVQIDVTLAANVPPGMYQLRLGNPLGISNAVLIGLDDLQQAPFSPTISILPAALHGTLDEGQTLHTAFAGKKGQRLVVDIEARRLGATFDPVIELYDPRRVQLAWSQGLTYLDGDSRLETTLPEDGQYSVELHDLQYRGATPNQFRLKIGALAFADLVYPLGGQRGTEAGFELIGAGLAAGQRFPVSLRDAAGDLAFPFAPSHGLTGAAPRIFVGEFPEVMEAPMPAGKLQEVMTPAIINGRISKEHEEDRYRLQVRPGMRLRFDVMANRAGSPLDGVFTIQNEAGATLAESDDRPEINTVDPGLDFTVPDGVKTVIASVKDLGGRGGPNYVYRLSVTPADQPDFSLMLFEDRQLAPRSGTAVLRVRANRAGYDGAIRLSIVGLPAGVQASVGDIPAGATDTLLSIQAPSELPVTQGLIHIVGEAVDPLVKLRRTALLPSSPLTLRQPWLQSEIGLAITEPGPIRIVWDAGEPLLAIGSTTTAQVQVDRIGTTKGPIRLSLLTSQQVPKTADGKQDDRSRALRFSTDPVIAPAQTATAAPITIPADLPALVYDLAIRADLLGADGRTVLASAFTPSRRFHASQPYSLALTGPPAVKATSGSGPTGKLTGKIIRAGGFNKAVTVTLAGLPAELPAPSVIIPEGRSEFELPVAFPYETKLGPLSNVRVVASSQASGARPLTSNAIPVTVQVVQGLPPPPPPALLRVFEDEASFAALLYEGDGRVTLDTVDRYSGSAALQVAGNQRFRAKMPGWSFKISARPGPGEFRYLRFAWKKRGGNNIMLQLNANGNWGPARGGAGPSYRYEAGPGGNSLNAAAIKADPRLPEDWVIVTRDLFADFGSFALTGIAFAPGPGDYGLLDHVYLARSMDDFKGCPATVTPSQPRMVFEDQRQFVENLLEGQGTAVLDSQDKYSGKSSVRVTPDQRFNERLPGLNIRIRQNPSFGEYRFLRFAWKKKGGQTICLQLNHDGEWGPTPSNAGKFRYHAGPGPECYGASIAVDNKIPGDWVVVTRDLYADFGEFTWTGIALSPVDGEYALFDHIYLGRTTHDFELVKPQPVAKGK